MPTACVVVPLYRTTLTKNERIALIQCDRLLAAHPRVFAKPRSLDATALLREFPGFGTVDLDDGALASVRSYNALMLSADFYRRFAQYEYILIHQLDALVFHDALAEWCAQGYDYIGAPWIKPRTLRSPLAYARARIKKRIYDWLDRTKPDSVIPHSARIHFCVGNGGFSLRRVGAFIDVTERFADAIRDFLQAVPALNEDIFFSLGINGHSTGLRIPDFRTAVRFAVEAAPREVLARYTGGELPFGCHAWEKMDLAFWQSVLRRYGHEI
ncbi:hypothetical protein SAMN04488120_10590 [Fontimonas thermophila]|uniref:DUF5672 domain-containing protein n=1 Tax=Fontimonas thermophila TaxID=1076937 RepID=A0A1I2J3X7_9GAMM|nr:DUF5672 family protein [Fontimonas thermophila]SFF47947.1 hypothetical protein SAMN04488120_10590 [Fontimonas thermophila]